MSMEDWDFGYYGKGLDGYVHFRQGIKEIESHAPYSKCRHGRDDSLDDLDDLDEYDDPEDDLFYEPPQKTPVSSAKPVMPSESTTKEANSNPQTVQTSSPEAEPQQETPTKRSIWDSKWWKNKWDYGFVVSTVIYLFFLIVEEIFQTEAGETVATATGAFAEAVAKGRIPAPGFFSDPLIRKAYTGAEWNGPAQGLLNPVQEVTAAEKRVQNGFSTRDREAMEMNGSDFYRNAAQLKREEKMLREVKENGENGNAAGKTEE